jgi:MFS family permease
VQDRPPAARLRPQVVLLGLISLLNDTASEMIYPLLPVFLVSTLGATPLVVGLIEGAADALASVLKLAAGWLSDRLPRRKPLVVGGYALATLSRAWISVAARWPAVLAARLLDRTGKGVRSAPRDAIIADVTPVPERGRAFGFQRALDHTGAVLGPLIALALLQCAHVTMRHVFLIAVIPGAIGVVLLAVALREPDRTADAGATPKIEASGRGSRGDGQDSPSSSPRRFWAALGAIGIFALANSSDVYLILQAHAAGVTTAMLPLLWSAHHVIKSLFSTAAGALSDRIGRRWLLVIGWSVYAIVYFIFPYARSLPFFFALFVVYAIPFTLTEGAERAWISDIVPAGARGRSFGFYYLVTGAGVLAGTAIFGELYQHVSPAAAFDTGAVLAIVAAVTAFAAGTGRRAAPPSGA